MKCVKDSFYHKMNDDSVLVKIVKLSLVNTIVCQQTTVSVECHYCLAGQVAILCSKV